jgi:hypothetical protein
VTGSSSGSCPVVGFGISDVLPSGFSVKKRVV